MKGSITASCGCTLKDDEEIVPVRLGGESCDAVDGFSASVSYHSYCPACAEKAKSWDVYLADDVSDDWWFETGYRQWRERTLEDLRNSGQL